MQWFIEVEQKLERLVGEMRVGFPEGPKQAILAWLYDVGVWISAHHMELIASLAVVAMLSTGAHQYFTKKKMSKLEIELARALRETTHWEARYKVRKGLYDDAYDALHDTRAELVVAVEQLELNAIAREAMDELLDERNTDIESLEGQVSYLEDQISDMSAELDEVRSERDDWECKADDNYDLYSVAVDERDAANDELYEANAKIDTLESLVDEYRTLTDKLDEAA